MSALAPQPGIETNQPADLTTYDGSDDETTVSSSFKVPSSTTLERPSMDFKRYSSQPVPSLGPLSDIEGGTTFFDAPTHPPTPIVQNSEVLKGDHEQVRAPLRAQLSANNVENFRDVVRRLREAVAAGANNPTLLGNGREMYQKAMRLQEGEMKTNKVGLTSFAEL